MQFLVMPVILCNYTGSATGAVHICKCLRFLSIQLCYSIVQELGPVCRLYILRVISQLMTPGLRFCTSLN